MEVSPLFSVYILFWNMYNENLTFLERFMRKNWKITKYRFLLQKGFKIQKQYHFWNFSTLIIYEFYRYFSRQPTLEGSTAKSIFSLAALAIKSEFYSASRKRSSASSPKATQNSEREGNVDVPKKKVFWGTHADESHDCSELKYPLISQSNLKLLSNIKDVCNGQDNIDELGKYFL